MINSHENLIKSPHRPGTTFSVYLGLSYLEQVGRKNRGNQKDANMIKEKTGNVLFLRKHGETRTGPQGDTGAATPSPRSAAQTHRRGLAHELTV